MGKPSLRAVFGVPAIVCAVWTIHAGKDVNWDLLHYHYYLPYEWLGDRLSQDFFAASGQSYLNPVGYLPFFLMVSSGWHSVLVSVALALAHSLSIGLAFLLAWKFFAHRPRRDRAVFSCLATGLAAATSVYWMTIGTSFLDPLLVPPMLGGLLLLLDGGRSAHARAAFAGFLFGVAAALKYSNIIFVVAGLPLAIALPGASGGVRVRAALFYCAGAAASIGLLAGPWLLRMLQEFGNPVFPIMNAWFQSPHGLPTNLVSQRFAPGDLAAAGAFPFRVAFLDRSLYSENFAPDLRFAAVVVAALGIAAMAASRRIAAVRALAGIDWRLFGFVAIGYVLWLATSANGRYGILVLLLVGLCLARLVERLLPTSVARIMLAVLILVQLAMTVLASPSRWFIVERWSRSWLAFEVPERARREPALYVTAEILSMASVAPFLHPASSFVNLRGQYSLPPSSSRLAELLEKHRGHVRTLGRGLELVDGKPSADQLDAYDATLVRIGYRVDTRDCYTIPWRTDDEDLLSRSANRLVGALPPHESLSVVSCALRPATRSAAEAQRERQISALLDRVEKSCDALFRGQTAVTEPLGRGWSRYYVGLDARLEVHGERMVFNLFRRGAHIDLGSLPDWERGIGSPACSERR